MRRRIGHDEAASVAGDIGSWDNRPLRSCDLKSVVQTVSFETLDASLGCSMLNKRSVIHVLSSVAFMDAQHTITQATSSHHPNGCLTSSPTIPVLYVFPSQLSTPVEIQQDFTQASRRNDTQAFANTITPATTASPTSTWLPPPSAHRQGFTPQPVFQDFELLPPTHQAARAASLDSTQQLLFNASAQAASQYAHPAHNNTSLTATRTRPPVPLFHANSTGSIPNNPAQMGGGNAANSDSSSDDLLLTPRTANVAYHDTMGDLFEAGSTFGDFNMFSNDFTAVNAAPGTVSPKDLMNGSVPPSSTFTNLTTPGSTYLETPDDSYEASPLYNDTLGGNFDYSENNFFPDLDALVPMNRTASSSSMQPVVVHPGGPVVGRKRSVVPSSPAVRPSSVAGVNARKRDKPLPPIIADENDPVALKRARNTAAARKSRARKVEERDVLETRIAELEAQLLQSQTENAQLSGERDYWKTKAGSS